MITIKLPSNVISVATEKLKQLNKVYEVPYKSKYLCFMNKKVRQENINLRGKQSNLLGHYIEVDHRFDVLNAVENSSKTVKKSFQSHRWFRMRPYRYGTYGTYATLLQLKAGAKDFKKQIQEDHTVTYIWYYEESLDNTTKFHRINMRLRLLAVLKMVFLTDHNQIFSITLLNSYSSNTQCCCTLRGNGEEKWK